MLNDYVKELCELLGRESDGCKKLVELSEAEQKALVDNKIEILNQRTRDMQEQVKELRKVQQRRVEVLGYLANDLNLEAGVPLQAILDRLQLGDAESVQQRLFELLAISQNLYRINQQTIRLIDFSIGITDKQVDIWSDAMKEPSAYNESGENTSQTKHAKIIEGKV